MSERLLLDTHAAIWLSTGAVMAEPARAAIRAAVQNPGGILVSPITAWEVALLLQRGRVRLKASLSALAWFNELVAREGIAATELTAEILTVAVDLPDAAPNDPADRIVIATAQLADLTLITRDRAILAYAARADLRSLAC